MNQHLQEPRCLENGDPADRLSYIFRGVSMGQLIYKSSGDRVQLVWRPRDKLIMQYFLAKHSFEPHMPKSFSMRGLAQLLDVNVESLDVAEWLAIETRMRSSLDYHLKRIMNEHSSEFRFRYDKEKRRKVYVWPEQLRDTLLRSICQGCQRDGDAGGRCALHIHVREDKHGMEGGGDETGPESPPGPEVEMDPNPRPSVTLAVTRPVSLASVPEDAYQNRELKFRTLLPPLRHYRLYNPSLKR
ncbi:uncharacterized protein CTRU02_215745 [Colletotrichum truncatum]|uniref:Uncharacterized protein n=1 Tax=Colletotrichum truncatum TaxID=5467 RepID=A0ACC3YBX4_COLTU